VTQDDSDGWLGFSSEQFEESRHHVTDGFPPGWHMHRTSDIDLVVAVSGEVGRADRDIPPLHDLLQESALEQALTMNAGQIGRPDRDALFFPTFFSKLAERAGNYSPPLFSFALHRIT
jgi:hypothetical protein